MLTGLISALLAQKNAKTPVDMIEGELGFLKAFTNKTNFEALKAFTNKTNFEALTNASRSGLTSALLAQKNAKTPVDMIEGELGFLKHSLTKLILKHY